MCVYILTKQIKIKLIRKSSFYVIFFSLIKKKRKEKKRKNFLIKLTPFISF